jgi:hypothetical protein
MKLIAYTIGDADIDIRPAQRERQWMDDTQERFAYRCLPLNVANAYGWEIRSPGGFTAIWDGEATAAAIRITPHPESVPTAVSHFGSGVLTFHLSCLFRTEPGYDLFVLGPVNRPKDAISPLAGIIETDWAVSTFTMNWVFTQPEIEVEFEKGEPICQFFPVRRGEIETVEPELRALKSDPELESAYRAWSVSRQSFNTSLKDPKSIARVQKWQKDYHMGRAPSGSSAAPEDHKTKLRLREFQR